ncbi:MAG: PDZ domain-containing protein [Acidimicrobiales bacterium]
MVADDDDWDEWEPPPDPSARTWRHPSEIAAEAAAQATAQHDERWRRFASRGTFAAGLLAGAGVCLIGLAFVRFASQTDAPLAFSPSTTALADAAFAAARPIDPPTTTTPAAVTTLLLTPTVALSTTPLTSTPDVPMPAGVVTLGLAGVDDATANGIAVDGVVLTSASAIADNADNTDNASVLIHQGTTQVAGTVVVVDLFSDIAVVTYDHATPLTELAAVSTEPPTVGTPVSLHGITSDGAGQVSVGSLIGVNQTVRSSSGHDVVGLVETTAELDPMLPGALLVDEHGTAMGLVVNCATYLAAAIPLEDARTMATTLTRHGWASDTWLGVRGIVVERGIEVTDITPASPAETAGLLPGDILLRFDGAKLHSIGDLVSRLRDRQPGDVVAVVIDRDGDEVTLDATLGQRSLGPEASAESG